MIDVFDPTPPTPRLIASICRCTSAEEHARRATEAAAESARYATERAAERARAAEAATARREAELAARTPDPDRYQVENAEEVGPHLVLRVKYPNCERCAYEGSKILVVLNASLAQAITWRRIDPHFRDPKAMKSLLHEAPSPAARFPGSTQGWSDAIVYAKGKIR